MGKIIYTTFIILALFLTIYTKQTIPLSQPKSIVLQVGQMYEQILPQFFQMYQAPTLSSFNATLATQTPLCKISQIKPSEFITNSVSYHYRLADPQKYFLGKKKISNFSDLARLQGIIDVIEFDNQILTLFQNGYYSLNTIDSKGNIMMGNVKLLYDKAESIHQSSYGTQVFKTAVNQGDLLKSSTNPENLMFIGEDKALIMNKTKMMFEDLTGYEILGMDFENAILVGNTVYVAMGFKGIFVYEVDFAKKIIKQTNKFTVKITYDNSHTELQVTDLAWDPVNTQLIITDPQQGLHWVTPSQKTSATTQLTPSFSLYIQNCQNLHIDNDQKVAVATCPEMLIVNLTDHKHEVIDEIDFDAETLIVNESRVMVFGEYRYAVYDLETDLVETGDSDTQIDFAVILKDWVILVNTLSISAGEIHPEQQKLMCHVQTSHKQLLGVHSANLSIQGICSQLYSMPMLCKTNQTSIFFPSDQQMHKLMPHQMQQQNCILQYTINLYVTNTAQVSYWWQYIAAGIIGWILCSGMIIYCVKDIKVKKQYEELKEEVNSSRSNVEEITGEQLFPVVKK